MFFFAEEAAARPIFNLIPQSIGAPLEALSEDAIKCHINVIQDLFFFSYKICKEHRLYSLMCINTEKNCKKFLSSCFDYLLFSSCFT
jgi:hypothetical protein